ncbi:MAG: hypothetical protein GTN38_04815 [Candidatus Aenigmarchaeota archaeon]|nr:hypothetical protein [Candidatus Aenigmarchaeota archaeon]NIP41067.1 hypothetical protein [Candidatus Aenigmarchaeota archaeon]NIQ17469.1 hypothetical protein [Candidatus Aenigmarchaeota archaeon]NIS73663.1 hypothetical protein [Candidatus Aenigmarchaeota archaeon]
MKGYAGVLIALIILITSVVFLFSSLTFTGSSTSSVTGDNASLEIWDLTDSKGGSLKVYAEGSPQGGGPNSTTLAKFFANYTNITSGEPINGSGIGCNISVNVSGVWNTTSMYFNSSLKIYEHNRTFDSRGFYYWNVTCDGSSQNYDILNTTDNVTVTNTPAGIYVPLATQNCSEDTLCTYNFSADCFDIDDIDEGNLTYGYKAGTEFPGFSMNSTTGMVTISITDDSGCGDFFVTLLDKDSVGEGSTSDKEFIVNAVNDKPVLGSVPNVSYQNSSFYYDINATDEETPSGPFYFNLTFTSCYRPFNAEHSNLTNCSGLLSIDSQTGEIDRTEVFENHEVGNYTINFTVTDPGDNATSVPPYTWLPNETDWQVVNFVVTDMNDRPFIDSVQNQFWAQNQNVTLIINASDIDNGTLVFDTTTLYRNLSVYYNSSLFPVTLNETVYLDNGTSLGNATLNFTPIQNNQVGNYTANISVYDGRENGTYFILVNFTVSNINDPPSISFSCGNSSIEGIEYYCNVGENTTDPDDFPSYVPYSDPVNGSLTFYLNFTYCNKTFNISDTNCSVFDINQTTGEINYTSPLRKDSGNYTLNISVMDGGNLTDWVEFNFTLVPDYQPNITTLVPSPQNATQNQSFFLSVNATDLDNATDNLTFRIETYINDILLNTTLFPIETDSSLWPSDPVMGIMNYTIMNNSEVGNYTIKIIVNDTFGREDYVVFNFTVWNINDPPILNFSCANYTYEENEYFCNVGENTTDIDFETPYGDSLTYIINVLSGFDFFDINSTTGVINFTATNDSWTNNSHNLTYVVNITPLDSGGLFDWEWLNITVYAVNDPPVMNFTNTSALVNNTFFMNLSSTTTDEENNVPFYYNVTFLSCSKINVSDMNCSIFAVNQTTGVISFVPPDKDEGNYTINATVRDSGNLTDPKNATGWTVVNFTVGLPNQAPNLDSWFTTPSNRSIVENDSITFFITVSDPNDDSLTCRWYKDGSLNRTIDNCHSSGGQAGSIIYKSSFEDSGLNNGTHNFTLEIDDGVFTTVAWRDVNVTNLNRPPYLYFPVQNQTWPMNTPNSNIDLGYHLRDPDNENNVSDDDGNLTFSTNQTPSNVNVFINQNSGIVTLTPNTDWYGIDSVVFELNDSEFSLLSNNVTLNVTYYQKDVQIITEYIYSGGSVSTQTKVASLTITVVSPVIVMPNSRTDVPVVFSNTGEVNLNNIRVFAETPEKDDISLSMSTDNINLLEVNKQTTVDLTINTFDLTKDSYEIKITGSVTNPKFNQSTVIYLENLYANRTKIEEEIRLVKDLFEDNPECLDLTELILEAEKELGKRNLDRAKELTETALQNCRDLIRYSANMTQPVVPRIREPVPVTEMIIVLIIIGLFTILAYYVISRRTERKARGRRKEGGTVIIRT